MPNEPRLLLIISAVVELGAGLFLVLLPELAVGQMFPGIEGGPAALLAGRTAGTALVSLGVLSWVARNQVGAAVKPALLALLAYNVLAVANFGYLAATTVPASIAPTVLHLALSAGFAFYVRKVSDA